MGVDALAVGAGGATADAAANVDAERALFASFYGARGGRAVAGLLPGA